MLPTDAVLNELQALGTEQTRKIMRRHGVAGPLYGVSYANLNMLKKRIKIDQVLARGLWATGIHDAQVLATMLADPRQMDEALLEQWAADLRDHTITDAFAGLVGATTCARACAERWIARDDEWIERAGWQLVAHLAMRDPSLTTGYFEPYVTHIGQTIHGQKNRVREAMNGALIAIGSRDERLEAQALAAAAVIGAVEVDHGETDCKTPDAATYIKRMWARREQKPAKALRVSATSAS